MYRILPKMTSESEVGKGQVVLKHELSPMTRATSTEPEREFWMVDEEFSEMNDKMEVNEPVYRPLL